MGFPPAGMGLGTQARRGSTPEHGVLGSIVGVSAAGSNVVPGTGSRGQSDVESGAGGVERPGNPGKYFFPLFILVLFGKVADPIDFSLFVFRITMKQPAHPEAPHRTTRRPRGAPLALIRLRLPIMRALDRGTRRWHMLF